MLKTVSCISAGVLAAALVLHLTLEACHAWINISDSLPYGIYQTKSEPADYRTGDLVLSCLQEHYARWAFARGYIAAGSCSAKTAPIGKHIAAVPGDQVKIAADGVYVNGRYLEHSRPALKDGAGQDLPAQKLNKVLAAGEYLLLNPKDNSFDSRYFGIVSDKLFLAKLQALLTIEEEQA